MHQPEQKPFPGDALSPTGRDPAEGARGRADPPPRNGEAGTEESHLGDAGDPVEGKPIQKASR